MVSSRLACSGGHSSIPRPEGLKDDVNFWIRVYTEVTTNEGFLHDERNLAVVYDTLKFAPGGAPKERQRMVDERRDKHIAALKRIIAALPTEAGRDAGCAGTVEIELAGKDREAFDKSVGAVQGLVDACKKIAPDLLGR